MADESQKAQFGNFPDPPAMWKEFSTDKTKRFATMKRDWAKQNGVDVNSVARLPQVPTELENLNPPPEPASGKWKTFEQENEVR
jgi:mediator of RNA polymerase II transcription subunit 7